MTPADYTLEIEFLESDTNKLIHNLVTSIKVSGDYDPGCKSPEVQAEVNLKDETAYGYTISSVKISTCVTPVTPVTYGCAIATENIEAVTQLLSTEKLELEL